MKIKENVRKKFEDLLIEADQLYSGTALDYVYDSKRSSRCIGWMISAQNIVQMIVNNPDNSYQKAVSEMGSRIKFETVTTVGNVSAILKSLLKDIDAGLLTSIEDKTRALVYDDFLDHAKAYLKGKRKDEAGVIAGVVFEDTTRSICRKCGIKEKGEKLDSLISELAKINVLTSVEAKTARVAADIRTKATHAQWDDFKLSDVNRTIGFTEELIKKHLDK